MTALRAENIIVRFGGITAVDGVSLTLCPGERLAVIGPNGAGKSTLFDVLGGQRRPTGGSVLLGKRSIAGLPPHAIWRLGVGRTFQLSRVFSSMTVREGVQLVLLSHHRRLNAPLPVARRCHWVEAEAVLERVGIASLGERFGSTLAYGDVKRVELALALAAHPKVLLMDEPTAGMAATERQALMALTVELADAQGVGVLFTEHDMEVVFGFAKRVVVMDRGRVIAQGDPEAIRNDPDVQRVYLGSSRSPGV